MKKIATLCLFIVPIAGCLFLMELTDYKRNYEVFFGVLILPAFLYILWKLIKQATDHSSNN
jgi:hypothetical protein